MAEKIIGLRIQLNGFNGVVTSIQQLEEELKKAKQDLNELEIGSNNFKTLQGEISRTETKLIGLRKASEGIGLEKQLEGYGKLAAGVTSSFAAAQAAVALFGNESTLVAEAAAQAQNLLTLALSARGIQEVFVGTQIVIRTVADKAATAATLASNTALKALYATIAANPIGALVTAIGLLVAAIVTFSTQTKQAINVQKELGKVTSDEASKLKVYGRILTDVNSTNRQRKEVIDELKKTYPGFNILIDKENRLNEDGIKFLNEKSKALVLEAQTKLIVQKIAENNNKILEQENQTVQESTTFWQRFSNTVLNGYNTVETAQKNSEDALKNNREITSTIVSENERWYNSLKEIFEAAGIVDDTLDPLNAKLKTQAQIEAELAKNTNDAAKATDAQVASQKRLQAQLTLTEKAYQTTLDRIKELVNISSIKVDAPQIIKQLEDIVSARKALVPDTIQEVFDKLGITIETFNGRLIGLYSEASKGNKELETLGSNLGSIVRVLSDEFGEFYDKIREDLSIKSLSESVVDFGATVDTVLNQAAEKFKAGEITKEAFDAFRGITDQYRKFNELIKTTPGVETIFNTNSLQEFLEVQRKIGVATGVIKFEYDDVTKTISEVNKEGIDYAATVKLQNDQIKQYTDELVKYYTSQYDAGQEAFEQTVKTTNLTKEQRKELLDAAAEGGAKIQEVILQISQTQAQGLKVLVQTIVEEETNIRDFLFQAQELSAQARALDAVTIKQGLLNNLKLVYDATQKQNKIVVDGKKTQSKQLISLEEDLAKKGIDISKFTEEEKLRILKFYLEEQVKATADAESVKQAQFQKTIDNLNLALQTISRAITDIGSIVSQSFQLQLNLLESKYQQTMNSIVGNTEEANEKRIEAEQIYQVQKAQIERKAQVASLKFTLAAAISSGAQAIVSALTLNPPASFIIAGINAGITLAQVGLIQAQINSIQSMPLRRGGRLQGGGLISGPSHEQGGVYAGGGYVLEGNESVINRQSTLQYSGLLSQINQQGGGRPIMVQSPMDSRLVEALAKQKSEPIRAYVVEQDITKAQTINRRLEQLASF